MGTKSVPTDNNGKYLLVWNLTLLPPDGPLSPITPHVHISVIVFGNNDNHPIVLLAMNVGWEGGGGRGVVIRTVGGVYWKVGYGRGGKGGEPEGIIKEARQRSIKLSEL